MSNKCWKMNTFQLNKLSELHDGKKIFFTKTDYIDRDLVTIGTLDNEVILISGNSDFDINESHIHKMPSNLKVWFATNAIIKHEKIIHLPIGLDNGIESLRDGHGVKWDTVKLKDDFIYNHEKKEPTKFIYSNFRVITNIQHRSRVKQVCETTPYITWEEPNLTIPEFYSKILDYEAVVCPSGNGRGDNHRLYEVIYLNRIPITFNKVMYDLIYHKLPVVLLDSPVQLQNYDFMKEQIEIQKQKNWNRDLLDINYWKNLILSYT